MRRFLTWAATGLLFVENCEVAHARTSLATPSSEAIDALFKRYDKETTPGCSVAVIQSGKVTFKKSYGMDVSLIDGSLVVTPSGRAAFPALRPIGMGLFETYVDGVQFIVAFKRDGDDVVMSSWDAPTGESGGPDLRRSIQANVTAADLQSYSGVYVGDRVEATLYLRVENERLLLASSGFAEEEITPMAKRDEFRLPGSYVARFERNVSGEITGLVLDASRVKGVRYQRRR